MPEPGPFPTGISAVKVSVRGRVFDGVRDDEGEPTVFELGRPARFVPAERKYSICTQVDFAPRLFWLGCILHPGFSIFVLGAFNFHLGALSDAAARCAATREDEREGAARMRAEDPIHPNPQPAVAS